MQGAAVSVSFDDHMHKRLRWTGAEGERSGGSIVAFDPAAQEGLEVSGSSVTGFRLDREASSVATVEHPELGPAVHASIEGVFEDTGGRRVTRTTRVWLPERFPNVAIFESRYENEGQAALHLDRVDSQRLLLDRSGAEPGARAWDLASFQGGAYQWGRDYSLIRLSPGFSQSNFQGTGDLEGPEGVGGGMPFVDVWGPTMGVALAHLETQAEWLSLPVVVRPDGRVEVAVTEEPRAVLGQQETLSPGEVYQTVITAVIFHELDSYDALATYADLLRARGVGIPRASSPHAHDPYFKTWGWRRDFTQQMVFDVLPELEAMGIRIMNLDDGWFDHVGDWNVDRSPGKFPGGGDDMKAFVSALHDRGFESSLWWYPLGVAPESALARTRKDLLVLDREGQPPLDPNALYQLCPAHEPSLQHIENVARRAVGEWGFDGLYTDFQGLAAVPPCFNPAHGHATPLDSFAAVPRVFARIDRVVRELSARPRHEVCVCALPHSPYAMPYYDIASSSDATDLLQMRRRVKLEKAMRGGAFAVGDGYQVPMDEWEGFSVPESPESALGTGAQLTTFYASLDETQRQKWTRWFAEYERLDLSRTGTYLNLYDVAWDRPEVHVIRKGDDLYYGIFADLWSTGRKIELRGLDPGHRYEIVDYGRRRFVGTVDGADPHIQVGFKDHLLLRARPLALAE